MRCTQQETQKATFISAYAPVTHVCTDTNSVLVLPVVQDSNQNFKLLLKNVCVECHKCVKKMIIGNHRIAYYYMCVCVYVLTTN